MVSRAEVAECAKCKSFVCRLGRADVSPDDCPMRGDFPDHRELYSSDSDRQIAYHSAIDEGLGYCRWTRLREVAEQRLRELRTKRSGHELHRLIADQQREIDVFKKPSKWYGSAFFIMRKEDREMKKARLESR